MEMKWYALMMIGLFVAMAAGAIGDSCSKNQRYVACIAHHTPLECESVK